MMYIVSSNYDYHKIALPRLLTSMVAAGIDRQSIHVFVGRSPERYIEVTPQATIYYETYGAYEHTALIGALEHQLDSPILFLLHDTCEVGQNFPWYIRGGYIRLGDVVAVNNGMCGFGLYKKKYLERRREEILALKGCDKHTAMLHEGFLVRSGDPRLLHFESKGVSDYISYGLADIYGTGQQRLREYYPQVDLWKYKANFGQTSPGAYIETI